MRSGVEEAARATPSHAVSSSRGVVEGVESRVRPPSSSGVRRTSPQGEQELCPVIFMISACSDIIGFSAVRASGFARVGESRIFFENTVRRILK